MRLVAVVPAFNPGPAVDGVVPAVAAQAERLVLVDDGSAPDEAARLEALARQACAAHVRFPANRGKGHALLAGIARALEEGADFVLTLDSDGQHDPAEIPAFRRLAERLDPAAEHLALGTRTVAAMPGRSRLGNGLCARLFLFLLGRRVPDTQTGYRLLSRTFAARFVTRGRAGRYETEMRMLVLAAASDCALHLVPIRTLYFDNNAGSKFRPMADTWRVLGPLRRYLAVAVASFGLDYLAFLAFCAAWPTHYLLAHGAARAVSASFNFLANHRYTFASRRTLVAAAWRYGVALGISTLGSGLLLWLLAAGAGFRPALAKPLAEGTVFLLNFFLLRRFVFAHR